MARAVAFVLIALPLGCTAILAADHLTFRDSGSGGEGGGSASASTSTTGGSPASSGGGDCTAQSSVTAGVHITVDVTWAGNTEYSPGNGKMHLWTKITQTYTGTDFTGTARLCGITIPDLTATPAAGGKLVGLTILDTAWDAVNMPDDPISGTQTGANVGSMVTVNQSALLLGVTLPNPLADAWPISYTTLTQVDHDSDGHPGFTVSAKIGPAYQQLSVNSLMSIRADKLYLATRFILVLGGMVDTCSSMTGAAILEKLESHVIGCHLLGGNECAAMNTQYVDDNRVVFTPGNGSYVSQNVPDTATCTEVRAAVP